jgi:7-cyano-7-deazaguanine tRNA-ribosyltransferase
LAKTTPKFKDRALFLYTPEDQFRPEILSYHKTVRNFKTGKKELVIIQDTADKPFYLSGDYSKIKKKFKDDKVQFCQFNPYLGLIPLEISDLYPAAHYVMAKTSAKPAEFTEFAKTWQIFLKNNKFDKIHLEKGEFLKSQKIPKSVKTRQIKK